MSTLPMRVKAVYEYTSPHEDDLHFPAGQIIEVTEEEDDDWYTGNYIDASGVKQEGIFPKNFVEKYEPTAPPRPIRASRPKKEEPAPKPAPEPEPVQAEPIPAPEPVEAAKVPDVVAPPPAAREAPPPAPKQQVESAPAAISKPMISSSKPSVPPPVSEKPSGGSFRDRIAAFNKAAPPVAPFKPGGLSSGGSNTFIKKPFVAPPPSKNAYVPVPREAPPQRIYKREEDPEIAAKETENRELAERSGLSPSNNGDEEDKPKPTSLKERIALLQKQQMEQAARHADAAQKKEKPKRPVKKYIEPQDSHEAVEEVTAQNSETVEPTTRGSMDSAKDMHNDARRRKPTRMDTGGSGHPRESFGDGNDADMSGAGDTTEEPEEISTGRDDNDEKPRRASMVPLGRIPTIPVAPAQEPDVGEEEGAVEEEPPVDEDGEEEEEEEDIDPEVRRKEELRARMAKMSGGMGMHGMFGPPAGMGMGMPMPPMPPKKKKPTPERRVEEEEKTVSSTPRAPPVPIIPLPGIARVRSAERDEDNEQDDEEIKTPISRTRPFDVVPDVEDAVPQERAAPPPVPNHESSAPTIPGGRPAPPPVPKESRPSVPPPMSPSAGYDSDDESSPHGQDPTSSEDVPPPPPPSRPTEGPSSPKSPAGRRMSYFGADHNSSTSPTTPGSKRLSRMPPPIPGGAAPTQQQSRAPPPPLPAASLSRSSTYDQPIQVADREPTQQESEDEVTEYEGDYDTDIASTAPPKDPLKALANDSGAENSSLNLSPVSSPVFAPRPMPPKTAPRALPPPLPSQPPPHFRTSADMPRVAPPPPPSKAPAPWEQVDDEYDPYKYAASKQPPAPGSAVVSPRTEKNEEDLYSASPPRTAAPLPERPVPNTPAREALMAGARAPPRQSADIQRSATSARRSVELSRMSLDSGYVANDVDLAPNSFWWTQPKGMPPILQGRKDVLFESEESSSKQGSKSFITKEIYVLYQDYSQTIITAVFDAQNPADVKLEQRHEQPPARQRQDQLEQAHDQFGRRIAEAIASKRETVVGDGTPQSLIQELLRPLSGALLPIGTRGYGAVVYSNLANASTSQNDEIRPGDIITLRNTKFQGKHGPMHAKYSMEVGKPDHVGVVAEWDGTKKKVRAWEQGRESRKVKLESFKLDDLRSGEVKIWRVMPRGWVGWSAGN